MTAVEAYLPLLAVGAFFGGWMAAMLTGIFWAQLR